MKLIAPFIAFTSKALTAFPCWRILTTAMELRRICEMRNMHAPMQLTFWITMCKDHTHTRNINCDMISISTYDIERNIEIK